MAIRKQTVLSDDLTGSEKDVKTVVFGFEGKTFEIDLDTLNRHNLQRSLTKYMEAARPVKSVKAGTRGTTTVKRDMSPVRQWAKDNGIAVSERGRISSQVMEAYSTAQSVSV